MDKTEYQLKLNELTDCVQNREYEAALKIVEEIDWNRVKSIRTLSMVADIYEVNRDFRNCKRILLLAYERTSIGKNILHRLTEISLKIGEVEDAEKYYEQYLQVAPTDNARHLLKYKLLKAKGAPIEEKIRVLETYKDYEYTERWAYELADLYHKAGMDKACVDACDDMILWFSEGKYVLKAMELKKQHEGLAPYQQRLYEKAVTEKPEEKEVPNIVLPVATKAAVEASFAKAEHVDSKLVLQKMDEAGAAITKNVVVENRERAMPITDAAMDLYPVTSKEFIGKTANISLELEKSIRTVFANQQKEVVPYTADPFVMEEIPSEEPDSLADLDLDSLLTETASDFSKAVEEVVSGAVSTEEAPAEETEAAEEVTEAVAEEVAEAVAEEVTEAVAEEVAEAGTETEAEAPADTAEALIDEIIDSLEIPETEEPMLEIEEEPVVGALAIEEPEAEEVLAIEEPEVEEVPVIEEPEAEEVPVIEEPEAEEVLAIEEPEAEEVPVIEEPEAEEIPEIEIPIIEEPEAEEIPEIEIPAIEEPKAEVVPEVEIPTIEEAPVEEAPVEEAVAEEAAVEAPAAETQEVKADRASMYNLELEIPDPEPTEEEKKSHTIPLSKLGQNTVPISIEDVLRQETPEERRIRILNDAKPTRMNDDQRKIFTYFARIPGMDRQILTALSGVYKYAGENTSNRGNIAVMGARGTGKTRLTQGLLANMCKDMGLEAAKIARVKGDLLNKRDMAELVSKMAGGFLIIEDAGSMSADTIANLNKAMEFRTDCMIVIIEAPKAEMRALLKNHPEFAEKFNTVINIPAFTNDELVTFARTYCAENQCQMDEMGVLALYTLISNNQTEDEPVTIADVKKMVDNAILRAKSGGKRFGRGRRSKGKITILYEKDFDLV